MSCGVPADQDVDPAVRGHHSVDQARDAGGVSGVAGFVAGLVGRGVELRQGVFPAFRRPASNHDTGAPPRQAQPGLQPDPARPAGDQRDLTRQVVGGSGRLARLRSCGFDRGGQALAATDAHGDQAPGPRPAAGARAAAW